MGSSLRRRDCMGSSPHASFILTISFIPTIIIFFLSCILFSHRVLSGPVLYSISPNFTASNFQFIDSSGVFLSSLDGSFVAKIAAVKPEKKSFYFVVARVISGTVIWSANRNNPISESSELHFSRNGFTLFDDFKNPIWSTRNLYSISSLQLLESGNLVMLDYTNNTVWQSFDFPTDVIVTGQKLKVGQSLVSSVNDEDLSESNYSLVIENDDAALRWNGINYWRLSMAERAVRISNFAAEYMMMNFTGVYLMGKNGEKVVINVILLGSNNAQDNSSDFRIMRLYPQGGLNSGVDGSSQPEFTAPGNRCKIPFICKTLGVCTEGGQCPCAPGFHSDPKVNNGDCVPVNGSLTLPGSCNGSQSDVNKFHYLSLTSDLDYFSNKFSSPVMYTVNQSACTSLCSSNCSCLGYFFSKNTSSCFVIAKYLGSITTKSVTESNQDTLGYIKTIVVSSPNGDSAGKKSGFPVLAAVLLPSSGVVTIAFVATFIWLRRRRRRRRWWSRRVDSKLGRGDSLSAEEEMDFISIPGLPVRFGFEQLAVATENFKTQVGSGGFGTVYKGTLQDGTDIAVKKITCLGARGRREFLTEIAVIGKIHHVNLVKLKGFCAQLGQKILVYEFMNRGSLDVTLFHGEPVLEWKERYGIALGTARGLAYLHTGCEHKIIHCDVKPENILLHDKSQVKISDFGLAKLLSPEESGLFTTLRGTRGYLAPEWLTSSSISDKTDVYSYGMVLLEIVRGKKNSSPQTRSNNTGTNSNRGNNMSSPSSGEARHRPIYFPLFALDMHVERRYVELVDPRLTGRVGSEEVEKLVRVALCCVQEEPNLRPSMSNVVGMLEGVIPLGEPRIESLNFLRFYGERFTEESRLEENNQQNELRLHTQQTMTNATSSYNTLSYMSSQQVSGPR